MIFITILEFLSKVVIILKKLITVKIKLNRKIFGEKEDSSFIYINHKQLIIEQKKLYRHLSKYISIL